MNVLVKQYKRLRAQLISRVRSFSDTDWSIHAERFSLPATLRYFNYRFWFLFGVLTLALVFYPVLPALQFSVEQSTITKEEKLAQLQNYEQSLEQLIDQNDPAQLPVADDKTDTDWAAPKLVIDKIGVDSTIVEGTNAHKALNQGIWRLPVSSTPERGGNTVFTAHRYKFFPPSNKTFYLLDKLEVGDAVSVHWRGKTYQYQVTETKVVTPDQVGVMANTEHPQITLITCTPLFSNSHRLIVVARLVDVVVE